MADREITFTTNVQGITETTEALKQLKQAFDDATQAANRYSQATGKASGAGGGSGNGPSAVQRGGGTVSAGAPGPSRIPPSVLAQVQSQVASGAVSPRAAMASLRNIGVDEATIRTALNGSYLPGPSATAGANMAGPSAVLRGPAGPVGFAAGMTPTTMRGPSQRPPSIPGSLSPAEARARLSAGPVPPSQRNYGRGGPLGVVAGAMGLPMTYAAAGVAVAAFTQQVLKAGSALQNTAQGLTTMLGPAGGIGLARAFQQQEIFGSPTFPYESTAMLSGAGKAPSEIPDLVSSQIESAQTLGMAYAGPSGAGATTEQIQKAILAAESNANIVQSAGWGELVGMQNAGVPIDRILAEHMNRRYGMQLTPAQERLQLQSGMRVRGTDLSQAIAEASETPEMQAARARYLETLPGQQGLLERNVGLTMGTIGAGAASGAAALLKAVNEPSAESLRAASGVLGNNPLAYLVPGAQGGAAATGIIGGVAALATSFDHLHQATDPLATAFATLDGTVTNIGGAFSALGTWIHSLIPGGNGDRSGGGHGGGGGSGGFTNVSDGGGGGLPGPSSLAGAGPIDSSSHQAFVDSIMPYAQAYGPAMGLPPDLLAAWAASESNWGRAGNALFGIKGSGTAGSLHSGTWEYGQGATTADFATYNSPAEAFSGLDQFLSGPRYKAAYDALRSGQMTPGEFMSAINAAGYATDPIWGQKMVGLASSAIDPLLPTAPDPAASGGDIHLHAHLDNVTIQSTGDLSDPATVAEHAKALAPAISMEQAAMLTQAAGSQVAAN